MKKNGENKIVNISSSHANETDTKGKIAEINKIDEKKIEKNNYFMSLMTEAYNKNLVSDIHMEETETHLQDILADIIWRYNSGYSTSVTEETAEIFIKSILSTLDLFCIYGIKEGEFDNNICVEKLKSKGGIKRCYEKGLEYSDKILSEVKELYKKVYVTKLRTLSVHYNKAINKTLPAVIQKYNKYYYAHSISEEITYFTAIYPEHRKGILYIRDYLQNLYIENLFCSLFQHQAQTINKIFMQSSEEYGINLFEEIFKKTFKYEPTNKNIIKYILSLKIQDWSVKKYILQYFRKTRRGV